MAAGDLVSLSEAKAYLNVTDGTRDTEIAGYITAASALIRNFLNRELCSTVYVDQPYRGLGHTHNQLLLKQWPITAVAKVEVDAIQIPAAANYMAPGYSFTERQISLRGYSFSRGGENVRISFTAGYVTIPEDVKLACNMTIKSVEASKSTDPNVTSESVPGVYSASYSTSTIGNVPPAAQAILQDYRRIFPL